MKPQSSSNRPVPTLFLDFDDVIALNEEKGYGGYDILAPSPPADLWERLFSQEATAVLMQVVEEFKPRVVVTTSWLRFLDREGFVQIFQRTGLSCIAQQLHPHWEAVQLRGQTRRQAIDIWMSKHHQGETYVILDDALSGTGLTNSAHQKQGRVILCEVSVGLKFSHLPAIRNALSIPSSA